MKNNKGFSIVEMIVVIAILAIMIVGGTIGLSYVQSRQVEKSAHELASLLKESQAIATSKYDTRVIIRKTETGEIEATQEVKDTKDSETVSTTTIVGDSRVIISYETSSGVNKMQNGDTVTLVFNRTSGGFEMIPGTSDYCEAFIFENSNTIKRIFLTEKTGKITVE